MRKNPIIINQVSAKFGAAIAAHASAPAVVDHIQAECPWDLPERGEMLVTNISAWRHAPADFNLPAALNDAEIDKVQVGRCPRQEFPARRAAAIVRLRIHAASAPLRPKEASHAEAILSRASARLTQKQRLVVSIR